MLIFFAATCLLSGSGVAAPVMAPAADSTGAELHWVDPANLPDGELKRQLEALEPAARRRALETLGTFPLLESGLRWLRVSPSGDVLTIDPAPPVSVAEQKAAAALLAQQIAAAGTARQKAAAAAAGGGRVVNGLWAFELHSRPSAARRLLLDFDGHVTTGALMNQAVGIDPIVSAPWDPAGDGPAFSEGELGIVYHIWQDISEEFAALDLDVTTEDGGNEDARCVISTTDWIGDGGTGGISFLGGFGGAYRTSPAFIFAQYYSGVKEWSDTAAHECAHLLGLGHDGGPAGPWVGSPDYYEGHASATGGWGPIMGVPRNRAVSQWSRGEYYGFLNPQGQTPLDDFALMASKTGYVPDEVGNDTASAVPLVTDGSTSVSVTGMVGPNGDVDMFSMDVTSGVVNLTVYPYPMDAAGNDPYHGANLDILVSLYNAAGELIGSYNPADKLWAALTGVSLPAPGRYYLSVQGTGVGTPLANPPSGYTAYGSVGRYTIGGTIPPAPPSDVQLAVDNGGGATIPPSAKTAARLQGTLAGGPAAVFVCWGAADGGTNATAWQHVVSLGALSDGAFATNVTGLTYGRRYYYRCTATNADGRAWAPATTAFVSRRPALEVTDGLVLWLDADQLGLSDGESVASFTDSSGAGHAASNGVAGTFKANIINGRPVVRFTTSQYLYTSASFVRPYTMLHVAKMNGGISARLISAADGNRLFGYHGTTVGDVTLMGGWPIARPLPAQTRTFTRSR